MSPPAGLRQSIPSETPVIVGTGGYAGISSVRGLGAVALELGDGTVAVDRSEGWVNGHREAGHGPEKGGLKGMASPRKVTIMRLEVHVDL